MHNLIGIPYEQMHCWALVRYYYQIRLDITLPNFFISPENTFSVARCMLREVRTKKWKRTKFPQEHAVAVFCTRPETKSINHVGVVLSKTTFLHTLEGTHSHIARLNDVRWKAQLKGLYTWNG